MRRNRHLALVLTCAVAGVGGVGTAAVRSGGDDGETETLLSVKAAASAAHDQQQRELRKGKGLAPKPGRAGRPPSRPDPRPAEGLVPVSSPFSSGQYLIDGTGWQQAKGPRTIVVYAGAIAADPAQGVVIVSTWQPTRGSNDQGPTLRVAPYPTPSRIGPVELIAAEGTVLRLRASDGSAELKFNVATGAYLP